MRHPKGLAAFTAVLTGLVVALTIAVPADAQPNCDVPHPPPVCDTFPPPQPPPPHDAVLAIDGVQQTTDRAAIHIWGWMADADAPSTPLTAMIYIDANFRWSFAADRSRPDVAASFPSFGPAHGFDVTVRVGAAAHDVCVSAVGVGGGAGAFGCRTMDEVTGFEARNISYNLDRAGSYQTLEPLDKVTNTNNTTVAQSAKVSGTRSTSDTRGWSSNEAVSLPIVTSIKVGVPCVIDGEITVPTTGLASFTQNGSTTTTQSFTWRQPVLVPARSRVEATVTISHFTVSAPYTLLGNFVYRSGARVAGTTDGMLSGSTSTNLSVSLQQFNLDGSPSAVPVHQPAAALLKITPAR